MPRQGEFRDLAVDTTHATMVLGAPLRICPDARGLGSGNLVLGVHVWTMVYLL